MKKAYVSVTNDLATDQRVMRTCSVLMARGFDVCLIGRCQKGSLPLTHNAIEIKRFRLWFDKGPLFYLNYTLRLFCFLISKKPAMLFANDLDTLLPNFLIAKIKGAPLVYDSHEYFTGVPELTERPFVKGIWESIERIIFPHLTDVVTVNASIANLYREAYGKPVTVVRNTPALQVRVTGRSRVKERIGEQEAILLLQGAGINIHRGAEELVAAMKYLDNVVLFIVGGGDVIELLKDQVSKEQLEEKVRFVAKCPPEELRRYTAMADIGVTLDKDTSINYRYSLPNKLFDYIHAGIAVLASPLPEVRNIVETYQVGMLIHSHDPHDIAQAVREMVADRQRLNMWKENSILASRELCWENEKAVLEAVIKRYEG